MNQADEYSAQSIRRRLLLLLLRAFGIVVFLTVLLILIASTIVIARSTGERSSSKPIIWGMEAGRECKSSWKSVPTPPSELCDLTGTEPSLWMQMES
jgi:hypothetical protein